MLFVVIYFAMLTSHKIIVSQMTRFSTSLVGYPIKVCYHDILLKRPIQHGYHPRRGR